jgi:hypothetical protein
MAYAVIERCLNKTKHSVNSSGKLVSPHSSFHSLLKVILLGVNLSLHELELRHTKYVCWYKYRVVSRLVVNTLFYPIK